MYTTINNVFATIHGQKDKTIDHYAANQDSCVHGLHQLIQRDTKVTKAHLPPRSIESINCV